MQSRLEVLLRALFATSELMRVARLQPYQVNGIGDSLQLPSADLVTFIEQLQEDGLVSLHWGGELALTAKGRELASGDEESRRSGSVSIGDIAKGATVVLGNIGSGAVVGYKATGTGATGNNVIHMAAPLGDIIAALQVLRVQTDEPAKAETAALETELHATVQEVTRPVPDQSAVQRHLDHSRSILDRISKFADAAEKLKPALTLAGAGIEALANWAGLAGSG
jgi:hypothetical protein